MQVTKTSKKRRTREKKKIEDQGGVVLEVMSFVSGPGKQQLWK
jgi:hypothetical protein